MEEKELNEKELSKGDEELVYILRLISPGTHLRTAIDDISKTGTGALIVAGNTPAVIDVINGGFEVNCKFTPQRLVELCKMDGAVILDSELKKILYANTLLVPNSSIPSSETGTRHKAAERTAKQTNQLVIAISERKKSITLYSGDTKYVLMSAQELLSRAAETLRIIEKHKEIFSELLLNLNVLEFTSLVSLSDVMLAVQRAEMVSRIAAIIKRYIVELGTEGNLVKMQLKELVKGIDDEELLILKDYIKGDPFAAKVALSDLSLEELIESSNILNALGYQKIDDSLITKGYRILGKTSLSPDEIQRLIDRFGNLQAILDTSEKLMLFADERKARSTHRVLSHLKEQVMLGKKI